LELKETEMIEWRSMSGLLKNSPRVNVPALMNVFDGSTITERLYWGI